MFNFILLWVVFCLNTYSFSLLEELDQFVTNCGGSEDSNVGEELTHILWWRIVYLHLRNITHVLFISQNCEDITLLKWEPFEELK